MIQPEATPTREDVKQAQEPCEGGAHCCCCEPGQPCCDCGEIIRSRACMGEKCWCGAPAAKKVGEEILFDHPEPRRHNLTAYVCAHHYVQMMGPRGTAQVGTINQSTARADAGDEVERVARAIWEKQAEQIAPNNIMTWPLLDQRFKTMMEGQARAAIAAMRAAATCNDSLQVRGVSEEVERVARLLCKQQGGDADAQAVESHDCWEGPLWTVFAKDAEELIAAMREGVDRGMVERPDDDALLPHLPESVRSEKRCGIQRSAWLTGWFIPWSPRNDNENAEGPWSHWVALAHAILKADAAAIAALSRKGEVRE